MNKEKMREEFEAWAGRHTYLPIIERDFWAVWQTAYASRQKEIDALRDANALAYKSSEQESLDRIQVLEATLGEQHQNQLDLLEMIAEIKGERNERTT